MDQKSLFQALKIYKKATRFAKVFHLAHNVALGCAAAALIVGGVKIVKTLCGNGK